MTALQSRVKFALNEARTLILVAQVMLGFQFEAIFTRGFEHWPRSERLVHLTGLGLLLVALALLLLPAARHRIVEEGADSEALVAFTTRVMLIALLPFVLGLGLEVHALLRPFAGGTAGVVAGTLATLAAASFWYVLPWSRRAGRPRP